MEKDTIIFRADVKLSVHADNKRKDILVPVEGRTQGLDAATVTEEAKYAINYNNQKKDLH